VTRFDQIRDRFTRHVNRDSKRPFGVFGVERQDMTNLIAVYEAALDFTITNDPQEYNTMLDVMRPLQEQVK